MCLKRVRKTYTSNDDMVVAYKIFIERKTGRNKYGNFALLKGPYQGMLHKIGKHYKANVVRLLGHFDYKHYNSGFHGYTSLSAAKNNCNYNCEIYEVLLWDITAIGSQDGNVVVAKNMRIMRRVG